MNTETRYQYNATGQIYKRPQIPDYTKRDNFFQTNQEKNIAYVQTADGKLMPFVPSDPDLAGYLFISNLHWLLIILIYLASI